MDVQSQLADLSQIRILILGNWYLSQVVELNHS